MAAVGVVGSIAVFGCGQDAGELFRIVFRETVGGGFRRRGFQVVQVAVLLLVIGQAGAHVVQYFDGKGPAFFRGHVFVFQPGGIQDGFVHANHADGGEVVLKGAQVTAGVRIQAFVHKAADYFTFYRQGTGRDVHIFVQGGIELFFRLAQVCDAGQVQGYHADGAGAFAGAEEAAGFLAQFPQVQTQAAAHAAHIRGLHVGVDVIGEVGRAVFGRHFKQETVIFRGAPVKLFGNGIGRNRVLEAASVGVAFDHGLDERLVHHFHFFLAVIVGEVHILAAHDGRHVLHVIGHGPVQGDIGEGSLCAPAGRRVHTVNKGLDALLHFFVIQMVCLYERSQVRIKGRERLSPGPFVLHDAQEVDHLVAEGA